MKNRWNTITPLRHVHVAPSGEHNDYVLIDRADLPNQFILSTRQLEGSVKTLALRLGIESHANHNDVSLRGKRFGFPANGSLGSTNTEPNDGAAYRFEIFETDFVSLSSLQMFAIAIDGLGMPLPVIDHGIVANVEPNSVVSGSEELVVSGFLWHEISCPADGEMIDRLVRSKAALSPVEVDMFVSTHQRGSAPQLFVAEVFTFQSILAARRNNKFGVVKHFVERRQVNRVQNSGFGPQTIADAFQKADCIERFGFSTTTSTRHRGICIWTNHRNRFHFVLIQRKQVTGILQQNHARSSHLEGNLFAFLTVGRNVSIGLRMVEKSKLDCRSQYSANLVVQRSDRNFPFLDRRKQSLAVHENRRGHFQIETPESSSN